MKRKFIKAFTLIFTLILFSAQVFAATTIYTVKYGDTMWKIASRYQVGISEIISANPQVRNASMIYPGQKLNIPSISDVAAIEAQVVKLVNQQRAAAGLQPLKQNWQLSRVARYKSQDMINKNYFSHQSPTYGSPFNMMESFGLRFSAAGENIAMGQRTAAEVMNAWMNSSGHRANILNPSYTEIGVGLAKSSSGVCYWTQQFMKPM